MRSLTSPSLIVAIFLVVIASSPAGSLSANYEALFVFGDSSVDTGNRDKVDPELNQPWLPPYGITWPGQAAGRFSDGKVLTDFYASALHVKNPIPFRVISNALRTRTSPNATILQSLGGGGVNFAFGGSGMFPTFGPKYPTVGAQIDELKQLIASGVVSKTLIGASPVFLSVVGNDYSAFLKSHPESEISIFVPKVVAQIVASAEDLYKVGFRDLTINNIIPVGCLPVVTVSNNYTYCNETNNLMLSVLHNDLLETNMSALQIKYLNAKFRVLDSYNSFRAALKGGKFPLRPCCEGIGGALCGAVDSSGTPLYTLCDSPNTTFFWDTYHPTQRGTIATLKYLPL